MTPEATIKKKIREYLKSIGAYHFAPVQTGMGTATVDILCCVQGRFIGVEVKVPGKTPTMRQDLCLQAIRDAGGFGWFITSVDELKETLAHRGFT